jgi:hypothetical protein
MNITKPQAFTVDYNKYVYCLETSCWVCAAFDTTILEPPPLTEFGALWDTGATGSVISEKAVMSLGLKSTGKAIVYHANGRSNVNTYSINILLPNNVSFRALKVTEGVLEGIDMLIGMDIISKGDFAVTTSKGRTKFSFQIPSTHDTDYVKEHEQS